jgi:hypothetical protein
LVCVGVCWCVLVCVGVCWCVLVCVDGVLLCLCMLVCWCVGVLVCWCVGVLWVCVRWLRCFCLPVGATPRRVISQSEAERTRVSDATVEETA